MKIKNRNFIYGLTFSQHVFCSNCCVVCTHSLWFYFFPPVAGLVFWKS